MKYKVTYILILLSINCLIAQNVPGTLLWEVSKHGDNHKSYLFGTFHEVDPSFFFSQKAAVAKFKDAEVVLVEQVTNDTIAENPEAVVQLWSQDKWHKNLKKSQKKIFAKFVERSESMEYYQLPPLILHRRLMLQYLQNYCDYQDRTSYEMMDVLMENTARESGKKVLALDKNQTVIMNNTENDFDKNERNTFIELSIEFMSQMLDDDHSGCDLVQHYRNQSLDYEFNKDVPYSRFSQNMLIERNEIWLNLLDHQFKQSNCFVAVGFRHLFYKQGLIIKLREMGYQVEPLIE